MAFSTPTLEKYRKGDLVQYLNNVLEIITQEKATTLNISKQHNDLATTLTTFNETWQVNRGSELTPQIVALDNLRDTIYLGFKTTVDAWANYHYTEEKKNASFLISDKLKSYGTRIHSMRYQQETATLNAIINDMENELSQEVALLNLTDWITKLKEANTSFNEKYVERAKELSLEENGIITELRTTSITQFRALKAIFEARMAVAIADESDTVTEFTTLANQLSTLTEQYNDAVTRTAQTNDSATEEETTNETNES